MLRLTILEHGKAPREQAFERFPISIGRGNGNAIVLPGWKVARTHAEIHQLGAGFKLVDKGSLAGTWVNGERVVEYGPLEDTDEVVIGGYQLRAQVALARARASVANDEVHPPTSAQNARATLADGLQLVPRAATVSRPDATPAPVATQSAPAGAGTDGPASDRDIERYLAGFEWRRKLHRLLDRKSVV